MMKKKGVWRLRILVLPGLMMALGGSVASGQVLFSNYSGSVGGTPYAISAYPSDNNSGWEKHAFKFQATTTGDLGSITIPIEYGLAGTNSVRFQVYSNLSGAPGSLLDYAIGAGTPFGSASSGSAATASFTNNFTLSSGTDYWLVVRPESTGNLHYWYQASPAQSVSHYVSKDVFNDTLTPSDWGTMTTANSGAFTLTAIPEPSTYAAIVGLVALCAAFSRSRRRNSTAPHSTSQSS